MTFRYAIYVRGTPERVWQALTDPDVTAAYWGHRNVSTWEAGATWEHVRADGSGVVDVAGTVVASEPPHRLVTTWGPPTDPDAAAASRVAFGVRGHRDVVRLTVAHEGLADEAEVARAADGWAAVLSNLKSLLETGEPLPQPPWEMPPG